MKTALIVIASVLALGIVGFVLLVRSHRAWLARQTPAGRWRGETPEGPITLEFEGGPAEGTYRQMLERNGTNVRESGRWLHAPGRLQLLVTATDEPAHPELGVSTSHVVRYLGPDQIGIEGPHRGRVVYTRVPASERLAMQSSAA